MKGIRLGLGMMLALFVAACGDGSVKSPDFEPVLQSITVTPATPSAGTGETVQFTAKGQYNAPPGEDMPPLRDITTKVTWTSSSPDVGTIGEHTGLATAGIAGSTTITASLDGVKATATLTSEGRVLRQVVIAPTAAAVPPGGSVSYTAQGIYSDSPTPQDIDGIINWTLDDTTLGTIAPATGKTVLVTAGTKTGETMVNATVTINGGAPIKGTARFGVGVLSSVAIDPTTDSKPVGLPSTTFTAIGTYLLQTGSTFTMPVAANWTAVNTAGTTGDAPTLDDMCDAQLSSTCKVTGHAVGSVTITAAVVGATPATATLTVTEAILQEIQITPDAPNSAVYSTPAADSLPLGASRTYYPLYYYSDAPGSPVTAPRKAADAIAWSTSDGTVLGTAVSTDNSVEVTALKKGAADLVATAAGVTPDKIAITVGDAVVSQLLGVRPATGYVSIGRQIEFTAVGKFSTGETADIADGAVTWSSADTAIGTIDANTGIATGVSASAAGTTITATLNRDTTQTASATLIVSADACTTPLLASDGATAKAVDSAGVCLLCGTRDEDNIINADPTDAATITVSVGALDAYRSIDVTASADSAPYAVPFAAGSRPGVVIGSATGPLVLAEVLSQVELTTLLNGNKQETSSDLTPLRLDLLGLPLLGGKTQGLVSFPAALPYDAIRIKLKGGLATALSTLNVYQACGTTTPPIVPASGIGSLQTPAADADTTPTIEVGAHLALVPYDFAQPDMALNSDDVTWTSSDESIATVSPSGVVSGAGVGTATITATLKDQSKCGTHCSATREVNVIAAICEIPLEMAQGASIESTQSGICLTCSATNLGNVVDAEPTTYGSIYLPLTLLNAGVTVTATAAPPYALPFTPGPSAGFVVAADNGTLLTAEIGSQIVVRTLEGGTPTGDASDMAATPLRLDLLGGSLVGSIGNNAQPLFINTTKNFDAVQITFKGGLLSALSSYRLYTACAKGPQ